MSTDPIQTFPKLAKKKKKRSPSRSAAPAAIVEDAAYRRRRTIVLLAMLAPDVFAEATGLRVLSSNALIRARLLPALMTMRNSDRRRLAACAWWAFAPLAAINWADAHVQQVHHRRICALLCCTPTPK